MELIIDQTKGPFWEVETGRRDGRVSNITEALTNLLPPFANITTLITGFQAKGLSIKDLAVLSGTSTPSNTSVFYRVLFFLVTV